jgi:hypothetical protein
MYQKCNKNTKENILFVIYNNHKDAMIFYFILIYCKYYFSVYAFVGTAIEHINTKSPTIVTDTLNRKVFIVF